MFIFSPSHIFLSDSKLQLNWFTSNSKIYETKKQKKYVSFCLRLAVLTYHAAGDTVFSAALDDGDIVPTLQGDDIVIVIDDNGNTILFLSCSGAYY